jgi:hypothetical protein
LGDDRKIACELTVEVQFSDGVPRGWMEEDKRTAEHSEDVPHEIVSADVVQFVAQNIFELGAVLLETDIGQQDGWANPPKGGGGCYPRQDEQSCPFNVETPGKRAKRFRDFGRWVGGETEDPLELSLLPDMSDEHIAQDQQIRDCDDTKRNAQGEGPGVWNLPGTESRNLRWDRAGG